MKLFFMKLIWRIYQSRTCLCCFAQLVDLTFRLNKSIPGDFCTLICFQLRWY
jgi:hypothetical protein